MYEENRIEFDWKGFLLKLAFLIVVIILIIKLLPLDNKNKSKELSAEFQNNMTTLREKSTIYFNNDKLPIVLDESNKISLDDLIKVGAVRNLKDTEGNSCDLKNSYVKATNKANGYELEVHLICGQETDTSYVYLSKEECCKTTTTTTTKLINNSSTTKNNSEGNNSGEKENKATEIITSKITKTTKAATNVSVIFNSDGGTLVATQYVQIDSIATRPVNPAKSGYIFLGWYYNDKEYNFNSVVNSNIILKAKWLLNNSTNPIKTTTKTTTTTAKTTTTKATTTKTTTTTKVTTTTKSILSKYAVTFDSNGGTYISSQTVEYGNYVSRPSNPTRVNAVFVGWYLNGQLFNFNTKIYSNITLVAKYYVTENITTNVYSSGWGSQVSTFTVSHTLTIPSSLAHSDYLNVRIKSYQFIRSLSTQEDFNNYEKFHKSTFEYQGNNADYTSGSANNFATIGYATISKTSPGIYDRGITWNGTVSKQCSKTFNYLDSTNSCLYGILYQVTWEYVIFR